MGKVFLAHVEFLKTNQASTAYTIYATVYMLLTAGSYSGPEVQNTTANRKNTIIESQNAKEISDETCPYPIPTNSIPIHTLTLLCLVICCGVIGVARCALRFAFMFRVFRHIGVTIISSMPQFTHLIITNSNVIMCYVKKVISS